MEQSSTAVARQALFALGTPRTPIVAHRVWTSTLDKALAAIDSGKRVVAILGPEGVGKTTLLHEIAQVTEPAQANGFTRRITMLDNADQLGDGLMPRVSEVRGGCLLMAGRPELALELSMIGPDAAIISMGRIWQADVPAYLNALCEQTGQAAALIEPAAAERLSAVSSGLPGVLTAVARTAALVAAALGADRVGPAHVESAARLYERRETLPASPAQLAALLRENGILPHVVPERPEPRAEAAGRQARLRPAIRLAALALGCAVLATGGALWFGRAAGPQDNTPPAPSQKSEPAPAPDHAELPQAAMPSPPVPPAQSAARNRARNPASARHRAHPRDSVRRRDSARRRASDPRRTSAGSRARGFRAGAVHHASAGSHGRNRQPRTRAHCECGDAAAARTAPDHCALRGRQRGGPVQGDGADRCAAGKRVRDTRAFAGPGRPGPAKHRLLLL